MSIPVPRSPVQLLEPAEVAALLYVDSATVARWTEGRRLIAVDGADGRRRYARDEVLRLMVDIKRTRKGAATKVPQSLRLPTQARDRGVLIAEAALDVSLMGEDVAAAAALVSAAAVEARTARAATARRAAEAVAEAAAQDVVASRFRAEAAAGRVRGAAHRAASDERTGDLSIVERAEQTAATVEAAVAAVALETSALAETVARVVAAAAELVTAAGATLERAIEAEVAATAAAVELRVLAAAALAAEDAAVRLDRVGSVG